MKHSMDRTRKATVEALAEQGLEQEARATLVGMARRSFGAIPAEFMAEHVLRLDAKADWSVRREALEALKRRRDFAERDELRVARQPARQALGEYETRTRGSSTRPYRTLLWGLDPVRASCGCRDFRRSSLGLCKHLLVVLEALAKKPKVWSRALLETAVVRAPRLAWVPLRPLLGADDWLERVRLMTAGVSKSRLPSIAQRFTPGVGADWVLASAFTDDPKRRLALVRELARFAAGGDPALEARLDEERERLELVLALRAAAPRMKQELAGLKRKLYPYQREGVARFLTQGRLLLADDMGLGKTVQAIAASHTLFGAGIVKRGLLLVPATLKNQWLREWQATSEAPIAIVDGSQAERARIYERTKRGFLIANYEQLLRDLALVERWAPDLCVLDEAQRIKNWEAKTSHAVKRLQPRLRLVLTGTPMENRLNELASIVEWVDDHALEPKWRLVPLHSEAADGTRAIVGARNLETLRARLAPCTLRRVRREVLDQLPERTNSTIPIDLTLAQREAHDELSRPIRALAQISERRALTQQEFLRLMQLLARQRQICNGLALVDFVEVWPTIVGRQPSERLLSSLDSPKLSELRSLVESLAIDQGRKVVVFSQWRRMLELAAWAVSDLLSDAGQRALFFSGQEGSRRRVQNLVDFHDDPNARLLFSTDAGSVGLNLQHAANACVLLELPWNPAVLEQRVGRIHRLGQRDKVEVYAIVARDAIEERIAGLVSDKQALFRGLFDGTSDEVQFDRSGTFLEQIRRTVTPVQASAELRRADEDLPDLDPEQEAVPELEEVAAREEARATPLAGADEHGQAADSGSLAGLLSGLSIERARDGGLRIHAPPESAGALAAMFEGLAQALRQPKKD